jgi:hypothetical protein
MYEETTMTFLFWGVGVILLLAGINAVAVWFGGDVAGEGEAVADH